MGKTLTSKANIITKILFVFAMLLGSFSHARTIVASLEYTMYFTAEEHVTLTVPSGVGYQEIVANKQYSLTLESTETLPELPTAIAEVGYETPTWHQACQLH